MRTILCLILFIHQLPAQKQGNIWYFAEYSGLDFSTGTPVPAFTGQIHSPASNSEGCSVMCDSDGKLLLYATPTTVWNKNHTIMSNGSGLMGGVSSTQGVLILPKPGSNEVFYVFTLDDFQNNLANGLRYSLVDMCLDDGLGDVVPDSKNALLLDGTGEKMTATYHSNGTDIWLVTRKHFTDEFYAYQITASGISAPVISAIGWDNPQQMLINAVGQMKISPDGSKIAFAVANETPNLVQLFDFDNTTGMVSNFINLPTSTNTGSPYGIAFSPDNSKLYVRGPSPTGLNQYDLSSGVPATIANSLFNVPVPPSTPYAGTGLQLANDGKIYVVESPGIGVVNSPNLAGAACNYVTNLFFLNTSYTFPGFIDGFNYQNGVPQCQPTAVLEPAPEHFFTVTPSVFSDATTITFKENTSQVNLRIYNLSGKCVKQMDDISGSAMQLQRDGLANGLYFIQVYQHGKLMGVARVVIN